MILVNCLVNQVQKVTQSDVNMLCILKIILLDALGINWVNNYIQ